MTAKTNLPKASLLKKHIDELAAVQSSMQQLNQDVAQVRNEARTNGFNMEAVHTLAQIIGKSPHDGGQRLLRDVLEYAHEIGINLETVTSPSDATTNETNSASEDEGGSDSRHQTIQASFDERLILLTQLGLGFGVAWMFISLLK